MKGKTRMAFAKLYMKNENTGQMREAPVGFSWTFGIFGGFVALYRKDYIEGLFWIFGQFMTAGFTSIIGGFIYNKRYIKKLMNEGFKVKSATMDMDRINSSLKMELETIDG